MADLFDAHLLDNPLGRWLAALGVAAAAWLLVALFQRVLVRRLEWLADQTSLSTINVYIEQVDKEEATEETEETEGFLAGLSDGWDGFVGSVVGVLTVLGFLLPAGLTNLFSDSIPNGFVFVLIEKLVRISIFLGYLALISRMPAAASSPDRPARPSPGSPRCGPAAARRRPRRPPGPPRASHR